MQVLGYDDDDRLFVTVPAAVVGAGAALLLGFGAAWVLADGDDDGQGRTPAPVAAAATPLPACAEAVRRADEALGVAGQVEEALDAHTAVVEDLMAGRLSAQEAVQRTLPGLTQGAQASLDLDVVVQRYEAVARDCRS